MTREDTWGSSVYNERSRTGATNTAPGHFTTPDEGVMQTESTTLADPSPTGECKNCSRTFVPIQKHQTYCCFGCRRSTYDKMRANYPYRVLSRRRRQGRYRKKYPERINARNAVARAAKAGLIIPSETCDLCGSENVAEAHHYKGYAQEYRLTVQWLCTTCHNKTHGKIRAENFP